MSLVVSGIFESRAQIIVGLNTCVGIPTLDLGDKYKMNLGYGYGAGINIRYAVEKRISVGINVNYILFTQNNLKAGETGNVIILPVTSTLNYYFMQNGIKPFVGIELGLINNYTKFYKIYPGVNVESTGFISGLLFAPVVGFNIAIADDLDASLSAKYFYGMTDGKQNMKTTINGSTTDMSYNYINTTFIGLNLGIAYKLHN